jgi:hypothetical protein
MVGERPPGASLSPRAHWANASADGGHGEWGAGWEPAAPSAAGRAPAGGRLEVEDRQGHPRPEAAGLGGGRFLHQLADGALPAEGTQEGGLAAEVGDVAGLAGDAAVHFGEGIGQDAVRREGRA